MSKKKKVQKSKEGNKKYEWKENRQKQRPSILLQKP